MSFFGFDTTLPRDRGQQSSSSKGFFSQHDAFAGLSGEGLADANNALDFEETYDGLGDQLDDADDAFNDDTFGDVPVSQSSVGRDFDFAGQTAKVADTIREEEKLYVARQPPPKKAASPPKRAAKPARTGYEKYAEPSYIPQLEASASIWGVQPKKAATPEQTQQAQQAQPAQPKPPEIPMHMMSLEEVEAMMQAKNKQKSTVAPVMPQQQPHPHMIPGFPPSYDPNYMPGYPPQALQHGEHQQPPFMGQPQILQRPQQPPARVPTQPEILPAGTHVPQILQRQGPPQQISTAQQGQRGIPTQPAAHRASPQPPRQILQNPHRLSGQGQPLAPNAPRPAHMGASHARGPSLPGSAAHAQQLLGLNEEDRAAYLAEDAKRAKRNHKIHLLSKDNGLMTPQDKNFITRIQLQQLVTATGGLEETGPDTALNEDFYYTVYSQIRASAQRTNPHQPASHFAQTYLFQTGGRWGRRGARGADNHAQRMEQQVQRAVEAAKAKPKNKQLVIEGSLGKISFSNSKTPKPLLNIKRQPEHVRTPSLSRTGSASTQLGGRKVDYKAGLRDVENVYMALMLMEDHERKIPPPVHEGSDTDAIQESVEWRSKAQALNERLWAATKVMEPIIPNSPVPHPFVSLLSHPKGKKVIPRLFRHLDDQQRLTILTIIMVHLDSLDVVRNAIPSSDEVLSAYVRESIDIFANTVMGPLTSYVSEAPLQIIVGLLGLALDRAHIPTIVRTRIGLSILTTLVSRAELLKSASPTSSDANHYTTQYNTLFDQAEPILPHIFPPWASLQSEEDVYVWQFLASMGAGASPDQQQRLVLGVKERVMETVAVGRSLPGEMGVQRLGHVNLFMRSIGLDVELLG